MKKCIICKINDAFLEQSGKNSYCRECNKMVCKKWYEKNKDKKISQIKEYQKLKNYASEKTESQRRIRNIKRKTRIEFNLNNKICEFCGGKATEHHHNTIPIEFDKFNYICHNCHINMKGG